MSLQALTALLGEHIRAPSTIEALASEAGLDLGKLRVHGVTPSDAWSHVLLYARQANRLKDLLEVLRRRLPAFESELVAPSQWPSALPSSERTTGPNEIIDFRLERSRHEHFFGREDALAELDRLVTKKPTGFVLVLGGPGIGKSALLSRWLDLRGEGGKTIPHHFIRRGDRGRDEPEIVRANLAAQVEQLYPDQRDTDAPPERRFDELLIRVSEQALTPTRKRLVLLVDGLDEAAVRDPRDNPVARLLPFRLPLGVVFVCASRPTYPHLDWFKAREQFVRPALDLDQSAWLTSNTDAVRAFWAYHIASGRFTPPLSDELVATAIERAQGNLLYAVKLADWLDDAPAEERTPTNLPVGLEDLLDELWRRLQALPGAESEYARQGLGLLSVAREALPRRCIESALGWDPGTADARLLCTPARQALIEEPAEWHGGREPRYRLYHESFGELVRAKMAGALPDLHRRLAEQLAAWPPAHIGDAFRRHYALSHGIAHRTEAARDEDDWRALGRYCVDVGYLRDATVEESNSFSLQAKLRWAAERCPIEPTALILADLSRALTKESHWIQRRPDNLPSILWNRLITQGWSTERVSREITWGEAEPSVKLRHPPQQIDQSSRTIHAAAVGVSFLSNGQTIVAITPDGQACQWEKDGRSLGFHSTLLNQVNSCSIDPASHTALIEAADGRWHLWCIRSGKVIGVINRNSRIIEPFTLLPGARIATTTHSLRSGRPMLHTFDTTGRRQGRPIAIGCESSISALASTATGDHVFITSHSGDLHTIDLIERKESLATKLSNGSIFACAVRPLGDLIAIDTIERSIQIYHVESQCLVAELRGHCGQIQALAFSPDGQSLVSSSHDGTIRIWDVDFSGTQTSSHGHTDAVAFCRLSKDGSTATTASIYETITWDIQNGHACAQSETRTADSYVVAVAPDGRYVVHEDDRTLVIYDPQAQTEIVFDQSWSTEPIAVIDAKGDRLFSVDYFGNLRLWKLQSGELISNFSDAFPSNSPFAVHPAKHCAVCASTKGSLLIIELEKGARVGQMATVASVVNHLTFSDNGEWGAAAFENGELCIFKTDAQAELFSLGGHQDQIVVCAFSPDGKHLASASKDRTLRVWDVTSRACMVEIAGTHPFVSVDINNSNLVAGDAIGNVWFFSVDISKLSLRRHTRSIKNCAGARRTTQGY